MLIAVEIVKIERSNEERNKQNFQFLTFEQQNLFRR